MPDSHKLYRITFLQSSTSEVVLLNAVLDEEGFGGLERVLQKYRDAGLVDQVSVKKPADIPHDYDEAIELVRSLLAPDVHDDTRNLCQNCDLDWPDSFLNEVVDLSMRVSPGEVMPSGECPSCQAVCHPVEDGE